MLTEGGIRNLNVYGHENMVSSSRVAHVVVAVVSLIQSEWSSLYVQCHTATTQMS